MKEEEQKAAIAKTCGWKQSTYAKQGRTDIGDFDVWVSPVGVLYDRFTGTNNPNLYIPDYVSDLNAMHEAEKVLTQEQQKLYVLVLEELVCPDFLGHTSADPDKILFVDIHTTAAQRAEAFLRTLNLWTE